MCKFIVVGLQYQCTLVQWGMNQSVPFSKGSALKKSDKVKQGSRIQSDVNFQEVTYLFTLLRLNNFQVSVSNLEKHKQEGGRILRLLPYTLIHSLNDWKHYDYLLICPKLRKVTAALKWKWKNIPIFFSCSSKQSLVCFNFSSVKRRNTGDRAPTALLQGVHQSASIKLVCHWECLWQQE